MSAVKDYVEPAEKIEILNVELLNRHRLLVEQLKSLAAELDLELGWHYLLDLSWIITNLEAIDGRTILDAGAGIGLMQWYLAKEGAQVISVDRLDRSDMDLRYRSCFHVEGFREADLSPIHSILLKSFSRKIKSSPKSSS